jgi:uncharacterized RDD family membrane protein YckC
VVSTNPPIPAPSGDAPLLPFDRDRLNGVIWRRIFAYTLDIVFIGLLTGLVFLLLSPLVVLSFGILWGPATLILAAVPASYHTLLIGGRKSSTWGQRLFGLEVRSLEGGRPGYLQALILTVLIYVSVGLTSFLILAVIPFTRYRQGVHDLLANVIILRRVRGAEVLSPVEGRR